MAEAHADVVDGLVGSFADVINVIEKEAEGIGFGEQHEGDIHVVRGQDSDEEDEDGDGDVGHHQGDAFGHDEGVRDEVPESLKKFTPDDSMVVRHGPYVRCKEVPCKTVYMGEKCIVRKLVPTEGTIYKGHQCKKCNHFYHSICVGEACLCSFLMLIHIGLLD